MKGCKESVDNPPDSSLTKDVTLDSVNNWLYSTITTNLQVRESKDVATLVEIAQGHEYCERFLLNDILPCIQRSTVEKTLVLIFLLLIFNSHKEGHLSKETAKNVYRHTMGDLTSELFEIRDIETNTKKMKYTPPTNYGVLPAAPISSICKPDYIASLLSRCLKLDLQEEVQTALGDVVRKCAFGSVKAFRSL